MFSILSLTEPHECKMISNRIITRFEPSRPKSRVLDLDLRDKLWVIDSQAALQKPYLLLYKYSSRTGSKVRPSHGETGTSKSRNPSSEGNKYTYLLSRKHFSFYSRPPISQIQFFLNPPPPKSGHVVPTSPLQTDLLYFKT